jgi:glutamate synthase (NADPH/NADH) small chain
MATTLALLNVKLFTDGADKAQIVEMAKQKHIAGFTTNPSLLKKAGVTDYESYARELVVAVPDRHISFEVICDDIEQMVAEGVRFHCGVNVGVDLTAAQLMPGYDAVVLSGGAEKPRDLPIPGRALAGIHFAMDFLTANTKSLLDNHKNGNFITAEDKDVMVIGGGDTGTDCVGTAMRHSCKSLIQVEILPKPPLQRAANNPWPEWPKVYRLDYGQEEAAA